MISSDKVTMYLVEYLRSCSQSVRVRLASAKSEFQAVVKPPLSSGLKLTVCGPKVVNNSLGVISFTVAFIS